MVACQVLEIELEQVSQFLSALREKMFYWTNYVMVMLTVVLETMKLLHFARVSCSLKENILKINA